MIFKKSFFKILILKITKMRLYTELQEIRWQDWRKRTVKTYHHFGSLILAFLDLFLTFKESQKLEVAWAPLGLWQGSFKTFASLLIVLDLLKQIWMDGPSGGAGSFDCEAPQMLGSATPLRSRPYPLVRGDGSCPTGSGEPHTSLPQEWGGSSVKQDM